MSSPLAAHTQKTSTSPPAHRLLYRGSLSLPDSHLLLEGLTFTINLAAGGGRDALGLLDSPLPLALESMRGRPSLRLVGITKVKDVWIDDSGQVNL